MSKNWLKKWVSKNPQEATEVVSKSLDAISKINVNETLHQFNRMGENINRGKEIENERKKKEQSFQKDMTNILSSHEKLSSIINQNNNVIDKGLKENNLEMLQLGLAANVTTARDLIQGINVGSTENKKLKENPEEGGKYIDIT